MNAAGYHVDVLLLEASVKQAVLFVLIVASALVLGTGETAKVAAAAIDWPLVVSALKSPAAPNSAQPQLSAHGDRVVLSWIERSGEVAALRLAERTDAGWTEPRTAASGTNWFVNWADVPSVVPLQDGSLAAHWLQKSAASTYAYDVRLAFSRDEGRTWSPSVTPHRDRTRTE